MAQESSLRTDRFGNPIDPVVGYARGKILRSSADEVARSMHGRAVVRSRVLSLGEDSVYNLAGLPRGYPLDPDDLPKLKSQVTYYAYFDGTAEEPAIRFMGGDPEVHAAVFVNRVSAGILAIAMAFVRRGDTVLSLVPKGRSHPSLQRSVELMGGRFVECLGMEQFETALKHEVPRLAVATPITPAKFHMEPADLGKFVKLARETNAIVFVDDAHMASRTVFFGDPLTFQFADIDLAVLSTDKHIMGPRAGVVVGKKGLVREVRACAMEFGLESQSGHYAASLRALQKHQTEPIKKAGELAREVFARLEAQYGKGHFYMAGPGVACSGEDALSLALERSGKREAAMTPNEAASVVCNQMLAEYGILTISSVGMPGAAPVVRAMMYPDGVRLGADKLMAALESGFARLQEVVDNPAAAREMILGPLSVEVAAS